jgi:phosphoribosylformylglycinamidine synthase subunit PurS
VARILVTVMLKPEILDPQGAAVRNALGRLGLTGVNDVRQGKQFVIELDGDLDANRDALLHKLAAELLANPVIEDYRLEVDAQATA